MPSTISIPAIRVLLAAALLALSLSGPACAQTAPISPQLVLRSIEVPVIASATPSIENLLLGHPGADTAVIAGELRLPAVNTPRLPAVILMHGSGGFNAGTAVWTQMLNQAGVATLVLDSNSGRKGKDDFKDFSQATVVRILDAYRALTVLASHPRIDPGAIYVMGFSTGGYAALMTATQRLTKLYAAGARFAGHIGLYPVCNYRLTSDTITTGAPMLLLQGTADEVVHISSCRAFADDLRAGGANVSMTEFAGAHHQFDNPSLPASVFVSGLRSPKGCAMRETENGLMVNLETGNPFTFADTCSPTGARLGYSADAAAQAQRAVLEFLRLAQVGPAQ
jgi:dienelactone hydrolase